MQSFTYSNNLPSVFSDTYDLSCYYLWTAHPALKREDRLGKDPFAGFGTVVEDITESGYTKNQPMLLGPF